MEDSYATYIRCRYSWSRVGQRLVRVGEGPGLAIGLLQQVDGVLERFDFVSGQYIFQHLGEKRRTEGCGQW